MTQISRSPGSNLVPHKYEGVLATHVELSSRDVAADTALSFIVKAIDTMRQTLKHCMVFLSQRRFSEMSFRSMLTAKKQLGTEDKL